MKTTKAIFLVMTMLLLGFAVEYFKVNINYHLDEGMKIPGYFSQTPEVKEQLLASIKVNAPMDYYYSHADFPLLYHCSAPTLKMLKWVNTIFFVGLFYVLNALLVIVLSGERSMWKWTAVIYIVLFGLSFAVYLGSIIVPNKVEMYAVSRKIAGALQSIVPALFLYPASLLLKQLNTFSHGND